jgi:hypothetical protein
MFYAVYITTQGKEWNKPLCVFSSKPACKKYFIDWYSKVDYLELSMRFAEVEVKETN